MSKNRLNIPESEFSRHFDLANSDDEDDDVIMKSPSTTSAAGSQDGEASAWAQVFPEHRWLLDWLPNIPRIKNDVAARQNVTAALRKVSN